MSKLILSRKNDFLFRSVEVGIDNDAPRTLQPNGVLELELSNSIHSVSACMMVSAVRLISILPPVIEHLLSSETFQDHSV